MCAIFLSASWRDRDLRYEAFFLTVWDLVVFARSRGILCQGRGSAANSAVCTASASRRSIPYAADLLFERFISKERNERRYRCRFRTRTPLKRSSNISTPSMARQGRHCRGGHHVSTAIGCAGRGQGLGPVARYGRPTRKAIDWHADASIIAERIQEAASTRRRPASSIGRVVLRTDRLSASSVATRGGFVITGRPLSEIVPIETPRCLTARSSMGQG